MWNDWVVIVRFRVIQDTSGGLDKIRDCDSNSLLFLSIMSNHFSPRTPIWVVHRKINMTIPWQPIDSTGQKLAVSEEYEALVRENPTPTHLDHGWETTLEGLLHAHLKTAEVIWDSFVALWRLEKLAQWMSKGVWRDHTLAWMVSAAFVCSAFCLTIGGTASSRRPLQGNRDTTCL